MEPTKNYELTVDIRCSNNHRGTVPIQVLRDPFSILLCRQCEERKLQSHQTPLSKKTSLRVRRKEEKKQKARIEDEVSRFRQWLDSWGKPENQE